MTKAKGFYTYDAKSKRKLDVVGHVNIKDFSWHQELSIKIPRKEIQWKSVFNPIFHSLSYQPSLHSQETTCITFLVYPTRVFLYENARKYRDFYISPIFIPKKIYMYYFIAPCCFHSIIYRGDLSESIHLEFPHSLCKYLIFCFRDMPLLV